MVRCKHMAGPRKPTWMPKWCLRSVNSDIGRTGLNRAIGRTGLNRTIGIKSRNWTVGIKSRDWTAEITWSGIRVMGHNPTDFAQTSL